MVGSEGVAEGTLRRPRKINVSLLNCPCHSENKARCRRYFVIKVPEHDESVAYFVKGSMRAE